MSPLYMVTSRFKKVMMKLLIKHKMIFKQAICGRQLIFKHQHLSRLVKHNMFELHQLSRIDV